MPCGVPCSGEAANPRYRISCWALLPFGSDKVTPGTRWNNVSVTVGAFRAAISSAVTDCTIEGILSRSISAGSGAAVGPDSAGAGAGARALRGDAGRASVRARGRREVLTVESGVVAITTGGSGIGSWPLAVVATTARL